MAEINKLRPSLERFKSILSQAEIDQLLAIQGQPLPTGIRVNRLKADPQQTIQALADRYGWEISPIPFCQNGWIITQAKVSPGTTIEHKMGLYYLQDAASMVPVSLFDMDIPHPLVLDMAASPGGKTTHLIDRTLDQGFIVANDSSQGRIPALRSVLSTWGGINLAITNYPGESFGVWFPETFDQVLLDAPCSMENLRPSANHPPRETTIDERLRLQERQVQLLISGLHALKTDGQLVYATCSLAPEEDEAVINAVLARYPQSVSIEDKSDLFSFDTSGLAAFNDQSFHPSLSKAIRLWPHRSGMSGFFSARITKRQPLPVSVEVPPTRDFSRTGLSELNADEMKTVISDIEKMFGLNFEKIVEDQNLILYQRHDQVFLIPQLYLDHFQTLPYAYIGMPLGRMINDALEPAPVFISRFGHLFKVGFIKLENEEIAQWIAGRDIRHPQTPLEPEGQYLLVTDPDGRNLGLGKLLPKRLRNMLPR
jgi:16S rRNA (cytosine1407-C5)-methyltransferase